jgi:amino acid adenylation domain-containing protein
MQTGLLQREPLPGRSASRDFSSFLSIAERIASYASTAPETSAVVDSNLTLTFADLELRSNQLANYLWEAGAGPEVCVGILMERSAQFVVAALAILKTGAAYLPIDASTPADRTAYILSDAGAKLLLTHRRKARDVNPGDCRVIELDEGDASRIAARPATSAVVRPDPASLAYVIYTSGSTGQPKGVEITHANLCNLIDWHQSAFAVTAADRASQVAGLGFDAAVWEIWPHLTAGATVYFADDITRRSPQALRAWLIDQKITISFVPTVLAEQLLHADWPADTPLRTFLTGADTLHRRPTAGLPFVLVNNYGPTECTVVATSGIVSPDTAGALQPSIGRPVANAQVLILDDKLHAVPSGEPGELCISGALVGRGYRNNPQLTAERFVNYSPDESHESVRVYRTGDRARLLGNGEIAFLGRLDDQVKIRGYRVELGEIVARLDRYPEIQASAVIATDSSTGGGMILVAYIVLGGESRPNASDLREFLAAALPDYMIPSHFVTLAELPVTASGKLDKSALPAPAAGNLLPSPSPAQATAADDGVQKRIAAMVAALLEIPTVEPEENFFMIGGHSMLGVQLVARIRDMFGVKMTLRQLFNAPTVAALAVEVARLTAAAKKK